MTRHYDTEAIERLLAEVGVFWPDSPFITECGKMRRLLLKAGGLRRIIEPHGLPVDPADWTDNDRLLFRLAVS